MKKKEHISDSELEAYIIQTYYSGDSNKGDQDITIEEHLSECDTCAQKAHQLYQDMKTLSDWNVFTDNQILINVNVYKALETLEHQSTDAQVKGRLHRWIKDFKGLAGGSLKLMMDMYSQGKRKATRLMTEGLEKLNALNPIHFDYEVELAPSRNGKSEMVVNFNKIKSENTQTPLTVHLDKKRKDLRIQYEADETKDLPWVLLLPSKAPGSAQLKEPVYDQKKNRWEIVFTDIDEGEYILLFEPDYMM